MSEQRESPKLYWTIGSFHVNGNGQIQKFYGVIWDASGTERWVGPLREEKNEALDDTTIQMMEMIKNG